MLDWQDILEAMGCDWHLVGSRLTSSIVQPGADWDYLVALPHPVYTNTLTGALCAIGFEREGGLHYPVIDQGCWQSLRRAETNLIVTADDWFIEKHRTATRMCLFMDVTDKMLRKQIFRTIFSERDPYLSPTRWQTEWMTGDNPLDPQPFDIRNLVMPDGDMPF